jgi:uncharacterized membrane protein
MASTAFAEISISPERETVNISRNDSIGIRFRVRNLSYDRTCVSLDTEENDYYIRTSLSDDFFCLNRLESTWVTATVRTRNAPQGRSIVLLNAESDDGDDQARIIVQVGQESEIELVAFPSDVCRGKTEHINVLVRNNSDEFKRVRLRADNEMLLPYFETSNLSLSPFQERHVELRIHASPYSAVGRHSVTMYATTDDESVKERVSIDVEKCSEGDRAEFSVRLARTGCFGIEKEEEERVYFRVRNSQDEEQKVYFSVGSELDTKLQTSSAWLDAYEEREFYFEVSADQDVKVEDYDVRLRVWNSKNEVEKDVCVRPEKEHLTSVQVRENDFVLRHYESAVFTILLENEGDYWEEFELDLDNDYIYLDADLSHNEATLERRTDKEIYVTVNVMPKALEEEYVLVLEVETEDDFVEKELRFRVVGQDEEPDEEANVEVVSYASTFRMSENSEKALLVTLKNNSGSLVSGIELMLVDLPEGIEAGAETGISLAAFEEKEIELVVKAEAGTADSYDAVLQLYFEGKTEERDVNLIIEEGDGLASLAGLFAIGGSALLGLAALIVVILVLVLIARAVKKPDTEKENESWIRG